MTQLVSTEKSLVSINASRKVGKRKKYKLE